MPLKSETRVLWIMRDDGDMTEPMNLMLLSALTKQNAPWRTCHLALLERDDIMRVVEELKPNIVAASAITGSHRAYIDIMRAIKSKMGSSVMTVLGGPYCSSYPGVIAEEPCLDAIGFLECDDAWPAFLDAFEEGSGRIDEIPNMITKRNCGRVLKQLSVIDPSGKPHTETYVTPDFYADRKSNLDDLPYLDRELVYQTTLFGQRFKRTHMAGRGCPFRCTYCFEHDFNAMYGGKGNILQRYSPERYCDELAKLKRDWPTRFIKHYDDVFPIFPPDREWLEKFAEIYPRQVGLPFHCLVRCDLVMKNPWALPLLKQAGIFSLTMSIESGNSFIRDHIIARDMSDEEIQGGFRAAEELGICTFSNTILAIPAPKIPSLLDRDFDEKVAEIVEESQHFKPVRRKSVDLGQVIREIRSQFSNPDGLPCRQLILNRLRQTDLHRSQLDYDRQSVLYTTDLHTSFGEFGTLCPYPRTEVTQYLIRKGYFDGDYGALHASYQNRSPLVGCFTEREKTVMENLALLGTVCILFSGSRNRFMRWLSKPLSRLIVYVFAEIPFRWVTRVYQWLYTASKIYMHQKRVYPMHQSRRETWAFFLETLRLDVWKRFMRKKPAKPLLRGERPGQFLGSMPSV
ncbi:MAG: radical SAM protein [Candidatus Liptonbacteria bacterium]|nr:radical SAM protein [Candidatus Liptonbacteria bacterium]